MLSKNLVLAMLFIFTIFPICTIRTSPMAPNFPLSLLSTPPWRLPQRPPRTRVTIPYQTTSYHTIPYHILPYQLIPSPTIPSPASPSPHLLCHFPKCHLASLSPPLQAQGGSGECILLKVFSVKIISEIMAKPFILGLVFLSFDLV